MKLDEFVQECIKQIAAGVLDARTHGVKCYNPSYVEFSLHVNNDGYVCYGDGVARLEFTITLE